MDQQNQNPLPETPTPPTPPIPQGVANNHLQEQSQQNKQSTPSHNNHVLGRRVWAYLIDLVPWVVVFIIASQHFGRVNTTNNNYNANLSDTPFVVFLLVWLSYYILLEWLAGGSLGKLIVGIRVRNEQGEKLTFAKSLVRNLLRIVDGFPYVIPNLVGFIIASTNDKKQRLGDKAAHTVVIKSDKTQPASLVALLTLLFLTIAGIVVIITMPASKANTTQTAGTANNSSNAGSPITAAQITAAEQASNAFVNDIESGDYTAAYQLTSPGYQAVTSEAQTAAYFKNLKGAQAQLSGATPLSTSEVQVTYNNYTDAQGKPGFLALNMQYVNNRWLVLGV